MTLCISRNCSLCFLQRNLFLFGLAAYATINQNTYEMSPILCLQLVLIYALLILLCPIAAAAGTTKDNGSPGNIDVLIALILAAIVYPFVYMDAQTMLSPLDDLEVRIFVAKGLRCLKYLLNMVTCTFAEHIE